LLDNINAKYDEDALSNEIEWMIPIEDIPDKEPSQEDTWLEMNWDILTWNNEYGEELSSEESVEVNNEVGVNEQQTIEETPSVENEEVQPLEQNQ
jgi:hypothetical protein